MIQKKKQTVKLCTEYELVDVLSSLSVSFFAPGHRLFSVSGKNYIFVSATEFPTASLLLHRQLNERVFTVHTSDYN